MDISELSSMVKDKRFFNLKKMQYKYGTEKLNQLLSFLDEFGFVALDLKDFGGNLCVYQASHVSLSSGLMKKLLTPQQTEQNYSSHAMETEVDYSLQIENIHSSRKSIRKVFVGYAPENAEEKQIYDMKKALEFISEKENSITEDSIYQLYKLAISENLSSSNALQLGEKYRNASVYVVGDKTYHKGVDCKKLPDYMAELVGFINKKDDIPELTKASMIHFYFAYLHPYFDGNGRMARLLHLWYLVQMGYSSTLFFSFSQHISKSKSEYYKAFQQIEENFVISKRLDITPFCLYFNKYVYEAIENSAPRENNTTKIFQDALDRGEITEKQKLLWYFVLNHYGRDEFSTKQLEKDFANAAYATIRSFVLKFEDLNLLSSQKYGNRLKYKLR